ncbi:MAG: hypothetical protein MZV64_23570 [Ignavibacteriales bacterium]|nr:hypothetical protein [Ignavibacteriales bacterium]
MVELTATPDAHACPAAPQTGGGGGQIAFASADRVSRRSICQRRWHRLRPCSPNMEDGACQPSWSPDGAQTRVHLLRAGAVEFNEDSYKDASLYVIERGWYCDHNH